jgi:hypothetical protein
MRKCVQNALKLSPVNLFLTGFVYQQGVSTPRDKATVRRAIQKSKLCRRHDLMLIGEETTNMDTHATATFQVKSWDEKPYDEVESYPIMLDYDFE